MKIAKRKWVGLPLIFIIGSAAMLAWTHTPLTFDDRIRAQEAIERVYYDHRIWPKENPGPKPPFERMISRAQIEAKVEDYLKKSAALDKFWQRPIRPEQLQAEMDRMAKQTQDPDTLRELFAALANDPYLIAECLARPVLADRLIRNWYAYDSRFHGDLYRTAKAMALQVTPFTAAAIGGDHFQTVRIEMGNADEVGKMDDTRVRVLDAESFVEAASIWPSEGTASGIIDTPEAFTILITYRKTAESIEGGRIILKKCPIDEWWMQQDKLESISWEGRDDSSYVLSIAENLESSAKHNSWTPMAYIPMPTTGHQAVWTGTEMIVWGGLSNERWSRGARYNPSIDSWTAIATGPGSPSLRYHHTLVWTGKEVIVWGGQGSDKLLDTGGRYDPVRDSWTAIPAGPNCPAARENHTAVWTGNEMIVWGGESWNSPHYIGSGGRYDPIMNTWKSTSIGEGCPLGRTEHVAIWTGDEMIVWGGFDGKNWLNSGGRYEPSMDRWIPTSQSAECPTERIYPGIAWTGNEMIIWGGLASNGYLRTGGHYNPKTDTWTPTATGSECPARRAFHVMVWTGTEVIVWGGYVQRATSFMHENTGGIYDPASRSWRSTSTWPNCLWGRSGASGVWTGREMIVWGGYGGTAAQRSGGRYDPATDSWVPTSLGQDHPAGRTRHTALWTGMEMIIWGGQNEYGRLDTGGRYLPSLDIWLATSTGQDCAEPRAWHTSIWTGREMIVWGGRGDSSRFKTGGCYDPSLDMWRNTSVAPGCPQGRSIHTAVWTGTEMIIWGGIGPGLLQSGGRYNTESDTWLPVSEGSGCPSARQLHTAVWTGNLMVVWGGSDNNGETRTGGRYNPRTDRWTPASTGFQCPTKRNGHSAVWTRTEMIIWGGYVWPQEIDYDAGGRYDPFEDRWVPLSTGIGRPDERNYQSAVWTGSEMVLWGGSGILGGLFNTGARYDPASDTWSRTSTGEGCPASREGHTAVWAKEIMIIWGGNPALDNGGIWRP
jgi:N-acetylneuraminic acid mutarotase